MRQFFLVKKQNILVTDMAWLVDAVTCLITDEKFLQDDTETHLKQVWNKFKLDALLDKRDIEKLFKYRGKGKSQSFIDNIDILIEVHVCYFIL